MYSIERVQEEKRVGWYVVEGGRRLHYSGKAADRSYCPTQYKTRKSALERIEELRKYDARLELIFAQDFSRAYVWTEEEQKQIQDYAAQLKDNRLRWTFHGQFPLQQIAREQHWKDVEVLRRRDWTDPALFHAEKRRVMAARLEAFRQAGVEF